MKNTNYTRKNQAQRRALQEKMEEREREADLLRRNAEWLAHLEEVRHARRESEREAYQEELRIARQGAQWHKNRQAELAEGHANVEDKKQKRFDRIATPIILLVWILVMIIIGVTQ